MTDKNKQIQKIIKTRVIEAKEKQMRDRCTEMEDLEALHLPCTEN